MSMENLSVMFHPELEMSIVNLVLVRKRVNEQTYRHTRNLKLFKTRVKTYPEYLQKIWER